MGRRNESARQPGGATGYCVPSHVFRKGGVEPRIILSVLAGLMLLCCGGIFFAGFNLVQGAKNASQESERTADNALVEIGSSWSPELAPRWFSSSIVSDPNKMAETRRVFALYQTKLGLMRTHEPFTFEGIKSYAGTDGSYTYVTLRSKAKFEQGPGTVLMRMRKEADEWKVFAFYIDAAKLR